MLPDLLTSLIDANPIPPIRTIPPVNEHFERVERLERFERLERVERLEPLERLNPRLRRAGPPSAGKYFLLLPGCPTL